MNFKKFFAVLIGCLLLFSMALAGCEKVPINNDIIDDSDTTDEDITVTEIDKEDPYTWFDVDKTNLPALEECQKIKVGMSLNQVIGAIGKPQRDIGHGAVLLQFDVADGSILTITFVKDPEKTESDPNISSYDCLTVHDMDYDLGIPDVYFPYRGYLNDLLGWIDKLNVEDIVQVRYEQAYIGVAPGHLKNISYSTNSTDIENTYRLLFSPLRAISEKESQVTGGSYVKYDFFTANDTTYSVTISNGLVFINQQCYRFTDNIYYAPQNSDLDCHSFITLDTPYFNEFEIYTYGEESVKVGNFDGLGNIEFRVYDGGVGNTPSYDLKGFDFNLLILSADQFVIEGEDNTIVYEITGSKDFSALFENNNE